MSPQKVGAASCTPAATACRRRRRRWRGASHPDRNAQFEFINDRVDAFHARGAARDLGGHEEEGAGGGFQERRPGMAAEGEPVAGPRARLHRQDCWARRSRMASTTSRATTAGSASASTTTRAAFAVESIARWWRHMGQKAYPEATRNCSSPPMAEAATATARGSGKSSLQQLCRSHGSAISVSHFPPGTRKWNKIEHRLFCHITENWRGRPLVSHETIVQLIGERPHDHRAQSQSQARHPHLRNWNQHTGLGNGRPQPCPRGVSRRLELHDQAQ